MKFIYYIFSILPLKFLYVLSDLISFILKKFYRKNVVINNLINSFPEKSDDEINNIYNAFYENLCDLFVEVIKAHTITSKEIKKRVVIENYKEIDQIIKKEKKPIIILATHQCNWEWLLLALGAYFRRNFVCSYKKLSNKTFDEIMLKTRSKFGIKMIEAKDSVAYLNKNLNKLEIIALAADQSPRIDMKVYWHKLLNQETAFYRGIELLPKRFNSKVFFISMRRSVRGFYTVRLINLDSPPYELKKSEILPKYVGFLEKEIYKNPSDWLWSHRRWKVNKR
tara:strand:+ start:1603 stop:2445 length:843 start_codon:yes stop_codon:yes gene_type:complete